MTSPERRRVAAVLAGTVADRVPLGELYVEDELVAALAPGGSHPDGFATRRSVLEGLHLDVIAAYPELPGGTPMLGVHEAAGGLALDAGSPEGSVASWLGLPEPGALSWRPIEEAAKDSPFFVVMVLPGPFGELAYLEGIERFLLRAWRRPEEARRLAEAMVDYGLALAARGQEHGAEAFVIGEDVAWERGLLLRARTYRELFLPALRREVEGLRALGAPVLLHSDGDSTALLADLEPLGFDGLHGVPMKPPPCRGPTPSHRVPGPCRWGNLDLGSLARGSGASLAEQVRRALGEGEGRGYIFGTSAGVLDAALSPGAVQDAFDHAHALACAGATRGPTEDASSAG